MLLANSALHELKPYFTALNLLPIVLIMNFHRPCVQNRLILYIFGTEEIKYEENDNVMTCTYLVSGYKCNMVTSVYYVLIRIALSCILACCTRALCGVLCLIK